MKRILVFILAFAVCMGLLVPVAAASSVSTLQSTSTVASDGTCQVTLSMELNLDGSQDPYTFPIPRNAADVQLGGTPARTQVSGDKQLVMLEIGAGSYTATISYTIPNAVVLEGNNALLTLELLSGFDYAIENFTFSVTLPGEISAAPTFTSGYYQQNIASKMELTTQDHTITGTVSGTVKDHETLTMQLSADKSLFADVDLREPWLSGWEWAILGTILLAAIYYCVTLFPKITRRSRCFGMPDGISAGELGTCLTGCGTDLTMLVISWAQLGYLTIEIDREDHVTLRKRMEMGNERSTLEVKCFRDLFHNRTMVDGTGQHYAAICRKMEGKSTLLRQMYHPKSGSPKLFRLLMLLPAILFGVQMGVESGTGSGTKTVFALALSLLCAVLSWFIQSGGKCIPLRSKSPLLLCLGCGLLWLVPGMVTGHLPMAIFMAVLQFVSGVAAAYGGKRSELGARSLAQIRGLRHHLRTARQPELQQLMLKNPDYFYEMAPYALALGLDRKFARRFGKTRLPESSYLDVGTSRPMNAWQWAAELRYAADILNKRQKKLK